MDERMQQIHDDMAARAALVGRVTERRRQMRPAARELTAMIMYLTHLEPELVGKALDYVVEDRERLRADREARMRAQRLRVPCGCVIELPCAHPGGGIQQ